MSRAKFCPPWQKSSKQHSFTSTHSTKPKNDCAYVTKMVKTETETIIKEHGFRRLILRKGKTKRQKTEIIQKNPKKVTLDKIGNLELYCYPSDYPEQVFIGTGNESQTLNKYEVRQLFKFYNLSNWYLKGEWQHKTKSKRTEKRRREIEKAYNLALKTQKENENNAKK